MQEQMHNLYSPPVLQFTYTVSRISAACTCANGLQ